MTDLPNNKIFLNFQIRKTLFLNNNVAIESTHFLNMHLT